MNRILITYDLISPGRDYEQLYSAIKELAIGWARPVESVWIVGSMLSVGTIRSELAKNVDSNDRLFVVDITGAEWASRTLDSRVVDWLNSYLRDYRKAS